MKIRLLGTSPGGSEDGNFTYPAVFLKHGGSIAHFPDRPADELQIGDGGVILTEAHDGLHYVGEKVGGSTRGHAVHDFFKRFFLGIRGFFGGHGSCCKNVVSDWVIS